MGNILQQPSPAAIRETPVAHSEFPDPPTPADTRHHWSDRLWEHVSTGVYVKSRIARLDRSIQAMGALQQMLMRDHRGVHEQLTDPETFHHSALSPCEVEGLHLAFDLIWSAAYEDMSDLRDNRHDCWGKGPRS